MRCPACKERVIDFGVWGKGINAFCKIDCPKCSARLRVSRRTLVVFICMLTVVTPLTVAAAMMVMNVFELPETTGRLIFGCMMVPAMIGVAYWEWRTGFYSLRDESDGLSTERRDDP